MNIIIISIIKKGNGMFHLHVWESVANNLIYSDLIRLFIYLRIVETVVSETAVSELCIIAMRKD